MGKPGQEGKVQGCKGARNGGCLFQWFCGVMVCKMHVFMLLGILR